MAIKIQAPEENQSFPKIYLLLLILSFLMVAVTFFFVVGFIMSKQG